jgi:hypothetical protein
MDRSTRHSRVLEATKEIFAPIIGGSGSAYSQLGAFTGYLLNGDGQYAHTVLYIPWDFVGIDSLKQATVSFLAEATLTPMTFRVVTDWCKPEHAYFDHNQLVNYNVNTVAIRIQEQSIAEALVALFDNAPLEAGTYLGVQISRQIGQNTNAIFLGVRIRYNTPIYAHTP